MAWTHIYGLGFHKWLRYINFILHTTMNTTPKGAVFLSCFFCIFVDDVHNIECHMLTNLEPQILTLQVERDRSVIVYLFVPRPIRNVGRRHVLSPDSGCQKGAAQLMALVCAPILDNTTCSSTAWSSSWKPYYWPKNFVFNCILIVLPISLTDSLMTSIYHFWRRIRPDLWRSRGYYWKCFGWAEGKHI